MRTKVEDYEAKILRLKGITPSASRTSLVGKMINILSTSGSKFWTLTMIPHLAAARRVALMDQALNRATLATDQDALL